MFTKFAVVVSNCLVVEALVTCTGCMVALFAVVVFGCMFIRFVISGCVIKQFAVFCCLFVFLNCNQIFFFIEFKV